MKYGKNPNINNIWWPYLVSGSVFSLLWHHARTLFGSSEQILPLQVNKALKKWKDETEKAELQSNRAMWLICWIQCIGEITTLCVCFNLNALLLLLSGWMLGEGGWKRKSKVESFLSRENVCRLKPCIWKSCLSLCSGAISSWITVYSEQKTAVIPWWEKGTLCMLSGTFSSVSSWAENKLLD